jgi:hypothetical protein
MNYSWYSQSPTPTSPDSIQQILAFGNLDAILNLKKEISKEKLSQVFLDHPKKIYTKPSLNFIQKFILHIDSQINELQYLKNAPRSTRF